jgi:hypothetical protein
VHLVAGRHRSPGDLQGEVDLLPPQHPEVVTRRAAARDEVQRLAPEVGHGLDVGTVHDRAPESDAHGPRVPQRASSFGVGVQPGTVPDALSTNASILPASAMGSSSIGRWAVASSSGRAIPSRRANERCRFSDSSSSRVVQTYPRWAGASVSGAGSR